MQTVSIPFIPAQKARLLPKGWTVEKDEKPRIVRLVDIEFFSPITLRDQGSLHAAVLLGRLPIINAIGGLGLARWLIDAQEEVLSQKDQNTIIVFPHTIVKDKKGVERLSILVFKGGKWKINFVPKSTVFGDNIELIRVKK
jgi:hypothetical protein